MLIPTARQLTESFNQLIPNTSEDINSKFTMILISEAAKAGLHFFNLEEIFDIFTCEWRADPMSF